MFYSNLFIELLWVQMLFITSGSYILLCVCVCSEADSSCEWCPASDCIFLTRWTCLLPKVDALLGSYLICQNLGTYECIWKYGDFEKMILWTCLFVYRISSVFTFYFWGYMSCILVLPSICSAFVIRVSGILVTFKWWKFMFS